MWLVNFTLAAIYAWLIDTGNPLDGAEMILFTNQPDQNDPTLVIADLTQPTFTGYTAEAIATWVQYNDSESRPYLASTPIEYNPTNATNLPQTIRGAALINGTDLLAVGYFPLAKVLSVADQVMHVTPRLQVNPQGQITFEADVI